MSSVLGVIVLIISMLLFYMYLLHVYPVVTLPEQALMAYLVVVSGLRT